MKSYEKVFRSIEFEGLLAAHPRTLKARKPGQKKLEIKNGHCVECHKYHDDDDAIWFIVERTVCCCQEWDRKYAKPVFGLKPATKNAQRQSGKE